MVLFTLFFIEGRLINNNSKDLIEMVKSIPLLGGNIDFERSNNYQKNKLINYFEDCAWDCSDCDCDSDCSMDCNYDCNDCS